ncbi:MAG: DUF424 family protein [Candidatus Micrarchaeota archaeon]|nr:DUF424 family protein [Candidatus Micrarchaeota archaeon]
MYLRIHSSPQGEVIALCDAELIGRKLAQGNLLLDLGKYADFYMGEKVTVASAAKALKGAVNINLVGKKSLSAAAKAGLDVSHSISISGVPHLQAYKI